MFSQNIFYFKNAPDIEIPFCYSKIIKFINDRNFLNQNYTPSKVKIISYKEKNNSFNIPIDTEVFGKFTKLLDSFVKFAEHEYECEIILETRDIGSIYNSMDLDYRYIQTLLIKDKTFYNISSCSDDYNNQKLIEKISNFKNFSSSECNLFLNLIEKFKFDSQSDYRECFNF